MRRILIFALAMFGTEAVADSWVPATKETHEAADHSARLTVTPRVIVSPLAYFQDKVDEREPAGAPPGSTEATATAMMEIRDASGQWVTSWDKPLVNEVAPVDVLITSAGQRVVTFDNWHSMGYGADTIAVYDEHGDVIRKFALEDVFPQWFVAAQPHTVSSIWWRGEPHISNDGSAVVIPINLPNNQQGGEFDGPSVDLQLRLSDGEPLGLTDQLWTSALAQAAATARQICDAGRDTITKWNSPIAAPAGWEEPEWHSYLREIVYRSVPASTENDGPIIDTTVLRPAKAQDFDKSVKWLREALTEATDFPNQDIRAIGSPDYERLTKEIERVARQIEPNRLNGVQLFVVADDLHSARVRDALSRSGAQLRIVSPVETISQRPERMRQAASELPVCQAPQP